MTSWRSEGIATNPITSRETPAQDARTSFRHPQVLRSAIAVGESLGAAQSWSPEWPTTSYVGTAEARALYAGQSVGAVRSRQPAAEIVAELIAEAERALSQSWP
jgi:hypothetical protein